MWISKASATQRAGRTGRVRPGKVYRLYSHNSFSKHEVAEVHRRPLQDVLLSMWVMLEDSAGFQGVRPFLQGLIEAPDMRNIEQSYQHLYEADLMRSPVMRDSSLRWAGCRASYRWTSHWDA